MTVKEWLRQVIGIEARIKAKQEQLDRYWSMATSATAVLNGVHVSGGAQSSRVDTGCLEYIDLLNEISDELAQLLAMRHDVAIVIRSVESQRQRDVLEMHYLNGWSLQRIANEMDVDVSWVYKLHGRALINAEKIWKQSMKVH